MPQIRRDDVDDIDVDDLESAAYSTEEFDSYEGEVPPVGLDLLGFVKSMWWTRTAVKPDGSGDDPMLKILWVAAENEGDLEEYNGCPFWLNAPLVKGAKFRWAPFFEVYGISIKDIKARKVFTTGEETNNGAPIQRIATFKPGEENDAAWCHIITGRERYNGEWQARVKSWLALDEDEDEAVSDEADEPDEDEPEDVDDEDYDEDEEGDEDEDDEPEDDEPEDEPEPPRRGRKPAAAKPAARGSRTASKAPAGRTGSRAKAPATKPAAARTGSRTGSRTSSDGRKSGTAGSRSTSKATTSRRGRSKAADNEPPF